MKKGALFTLVMSALWFLPAAAHFSKNVRQGFAATSLYKSLVVNDIHINLYLCGRADIIAPTKGIDDTFFADASFYRYGKEQPFTTIGLDEEIIIYGYKNGYVAVYEKLFPMFPKEIHHSILEISIYIDRSLNITVGPLNNPLEISGIFFEVDLKK